MPRKRSELLSEEMEALRAEIEVVEGLDEPSEDDIARANASLAEWDQKDAELKEALAREAKVEEVLRARLRTQPEDGDGPARRQAPNVNIKIDPFENNEELKRSVWSKSQFNAKDTLSRAMAAVEQTPRYKWGVSSSKEQDTVKEKLDDLLHLDNQHAPLIARHMLLTGSEQYHEEFKEYVASRGSYVPEALRTAMSLTDANGGYLVPFTLDPTVILTNAGIAGPLRTISTIKTIATNDWNGVTSAGVNAEWIGEGLEAGDSSPTFGQPVITPKRADAWVFGSYEVLADSGFAAELGRLLSDAKVRLEEAAFATANTGATIPRGIVAAVAAVTASIVTAAATNAFGVNDVYNTSDALRPRDASQASWIANKKFYSLIRRFDTAGGSAFWANLGMGVPPNLLGQPAYECSTMTSVVSTGANVLLAGNFAEYYIVDRIGMSVMYEPMIRSTGNGRPTGQGGWFAFWRVGADCVDPSAFRLLQLNQVAAATALG
jgi:HK97 family phage major capsid protein